MSSRQGQGTFSSWSQETTEEDLERSRGVFAYQVCANELVIPALFLKLSPGETGPEEATLPLSSTRCKSHARKSTSRSVSDERRERPE